MTDTVQLIKETLNIVDVVSPYVKLKKSGKYWTGLSPFNKEKTPSFFVSPDRGSYHCFSSGEGGDMFSFVEKMEGVDFKGALKILADKAGVTIEYNGTGKENKGKTDRLREAMLQAETFFAEHLTEESEAYKYALSRGVTKENIRAWNLGYAPDEWRAALESLNTKGFTPEELLAAGIIKEADEKKGTFYDRFRNRLMFPIRDSAGRAVAFTGRALTPDDQAKYLNSPETELFRKSAVLFGMDRAKDAIRTRGFAIVVEGQFDLVMLHQIGFTNTVALSGTALSNEHISLIKRYADNLMLALDADRAGLAASAKSAHIALAAGMRVKAVRLPAGKDPADAAVEDAEDLKKRVKESESIVEFFLSVLAGSESDAHKLLLSVERIVLPLIKAIPSPLEQEHFVTATARALGTTPEAVRASLARVPAGELQKEGSVANPAQAKPEQESARKKRGDFLRAIMQAYAGTSLAKHLENEYARITGTTPPEEPLADATLFEAELAFGEDPAENAADEVVRVFEKLVLDEEYALATTQLLRAEQSKNEEEIAEATRKCQELSKRRAALI